MARTIAEIYNSMISEKESFSSLDSYTTMPDDAQKMLTELTTTKKVGIWRLIFWVCSFAIWIHENLFDEFKAEVQTIAETLIPGHLKWWVSELKKFQYGDSLTYNETTRKFEYATLDTDKQIILQSAATEANGLLTLKVAKSDGATGLEKLTSPEKAALQSYIDDIRPAGVAITLISDDPDDIKIIATVYVDNTVFYNDETNPSDPLNGSLLSDSTVFPVVDAIENYISTLDFNGSYYVIKLIDAIQSVTGVTNVVITTNEAKYGALAYTNILTTTSQSYASNAGYLAVDGSFPLASNITYKNA